MKSLLPPRKKDWSQGRVQVGVAIRAEHGSYIEMVDNNASEETVKAFAVLMKLITDDLKAKEG